MKLSRIDYIGLNGGDGEHYDMDILERLKLQPKVNGSHTQDISDAITEIEKLRSDVKVLNGALTLTSEGNARLYYELATLKAQQTAKQAQEPVAWLCSNNPGGHEQLFMSHEGEYGAFPVYTSAPAGHSPADLTLPECTCGDAGSLGIIHRNDGPCFYYTESTIPEGENEAVRMFLMYYGGNSGVTLDGMRENMAMAGFDGHWPLWVSGSDGHLTKSGAQDWIKHLLLSAAPKPSI